MTTELRFDQHYALASGREVISFINELRKRFALQKFEQEYQSDREWGQLENDSVFVKVVHAFAHDTFNRQKPKLFPKGCNYSITVRIKADAPEKWDERWIAEKWGPRWLETLKELSDGGRVFSNKKLIS